MFWASWFPCSMPALDCSLGSQLLLRKLPSYTETILSLTASRYTQQHGHSKDFPAHKVFIPPANSLLVGSSDFVVASLLLRHLVRHFGNWSDVLVSSKQGCFFPSSASCIPILLLLLPLLMLSGAFGGKKKLTKEMNYA